MSDELSKKHAIEHLTAAGFHVEQIPSDPLKQRADLRARWAEEEYLVEAKHKNESEKWLDFVERRQPDASDSIDRRIVPWNAIASVVKEGCKQLAATPANADTFRLLWMVSLHEDDEFVMECIKCRLFGLETVAVMEAGFATKPCFYHSFSDFRLYPELDGVVLSVRKGSKLCVNSFSLRRERFCKSQLYNQFNELGSVCDPVILERTHDAFIIGSDFIAKPDGREQWVYLRNKYGVRTTVMQRSRFDGRLTIPIPQKPSE